MKKPRVLLHLAALAMGLCLLAGCAAQPAAPAQATIPHIETSPQPQPLIHITAPPRHPILWGGGGGGDI